jgi:hypothetical protein
VDTDRALDRKVAEKVMRLEPWRSIPYYSTDLKDAAEIAQARRIALVPYEQGWRAFSLSRSIGDREGGYVGWFGSDLVYDREPARAVCLAALKQVGETP